MRTCLSLLFVAAIAGVVMGQGNEKALASLQGKWVMSKMVVLGKALPEADLKKAKITLTIKNGTYAREDKGKIQVDATKAPKHLDLIAEEGKEKGKVYQFIYVIEGDTLTMAQSLLPDSRPANFLTGPGEPTMVITYVREK